MDDGVTYAKTVTRSGGEIRSIIRANNLLWTHVKSGGGAAAVASLFLWTCSCSVRTMAHGDIRNRLQLSLQTIKAAMAYIQAMQCIISIRERSTMLSILEAIRGCRVNRRYTLRISTFVYIHKYGQYIRVRIYIWSQYAWKGGIVPKIE